MVLACARALCYHIGMIQATSLSPELEDRLRGCLMGLMCGDALGAPLEFHSLEDLERHHPGGVSDMVEGWGTTSDRAKGDITDDSEMAIALLRSLVRAGRFDREDVLESYRDWLDTDPADVGTTTVNGLLGECMADSQANGALMRVAPLAIFAALNPACDWEGAAEEDSCLTHVHPKCWHANVIFVESLLLALRGERPAFIYAAALSRAAVLRDEALVARLKAAAREEPACYHSSAGWVEVAFHAAYYWLLHAKDYRTAMCALVNRLGDPDTNAAIAGALLGARFGEKAIPKPWRRAVLNGSRSRPHFLSAQAGMSLVQRLIARGVVQGELPMPEAAAAAAAPPGLWGRLQRWFVS